MFLCVCVIHSCLLTHPQDAVAVTATVWSTDLKLFIVWLYRKTEDSWGDVLRLGVGLCQLCLLKHLSLPFPGGLPCHPLCGQPFSLTNASPILFLCLFLTSEVFFYQSESGPSIFLSMLSAGSPGSEEATALLRCF